MLMGNCKYCLKPAGFFRSKHAECETEHLLYLQFVQDKRSEIYSDVLRSIKGELALDELKKIITNAEKASYLLPADRNSFLAKGWESAVDQFLEDGILDKTEEKRLVEFQNYFSLSQIDLDQNGALTKTAKAGILRDILNGVIPQRVTLDGQLVINFQKDEQVVWAFPGSQYLEDKTRRQFVGRSQGVSIRIMKGVYYRAGAFKGHPVEYTERVLVDTGLVVITNKNIYFAGPQKSIRIPYTKIISFEPFSDGIGIMKDAATAKQQIFITGDGWFTYNLVVNLSQR